MNTIIKDDPSVIADPAIVSRQLKSQVTDEARAKHKERADIPFLFHALIAASLVALVLISRYSPDYYVAISQEDHLIEWVTAVFYLSAAFIGFRYALHHRRVFDGLIALYCLFVGGEEFSWGQRLLGINPPKYFMENNVQQELTLHNFFGASAHDLVFFVAVIGYGVLLPLMSRHARLRRLLEKFGATAPPIRFAPWCIFLIALYIWYPIHLSSEWVEAIVAALFLAGSAMLARKRLTSKAILISLTLALVISFGLTIISSAQERKGNPERVACAQAEVQSLLYDIIYNRAATEKLLNVQQPIHRRVWVAENHDYLLPDRIQEFPATRCSNLTDQNTQARRRYAVDPWGLSYWLYVEKLPNGQQQLTVYSFGPNRRRDSNESTPGLKSSAEDDDIAVVGIIPGSIEAETELNSP